MNYLDAKVNFDGWVLPNVRYQERTGATVCYALGLLLFLVLGGSRSGSVVAPSRAVGRLCLSCLGEVAPGARPLGTRSGGVACGPHP